MCLCVCVCCWTPECPVFPNDEVVELQPWAVTNPDLGSGSNVYTISNPPPNMFQPCSGSPPPPPPGPISYRPPPIFHPPTPLLSLFAPTSSPPITPSHGETIHLDVPPARRLPPLICTSLPFRAAQRSSLRNPVTAFPFPVVSSFYPQPKPRSL